MNRSEQINELAAALAKAQMEMKAAPKNSVNPAFKRPGETTGTKYAALPDVIEASKALAKHGLAFVQPASVADDGAVTVETVLMHSSGQWLSERLSLRPQASTPQGFGSAMTYGRRYGLSSLVGIAADEDDDGNEASRKPSNGHTGNGERPAPAPVPAKQAEPAPPDPSIKLCMEIKERIVKCPSVAEMVKLDTEIAEAHKKHAINDAQKARLGEIVSARLKDVRTLQENAA